MDWIYAVLLAFSGLLFISSFFMKDPYKKVREEIDELSMQHIQDFYQIKKKIKILEEELLVSEEDFKKPFPVLPPDSAPEKREIHAIIKNQVLLLAHQGLSVEQIARQSSLSNNDVKMILQTSQARGGKL